MKQPMDKALQVAGEKLSEILTISEWADEMNYNSPKYFSRKFRNHYGIRPKSKLVELKLNRFFELIQRKPEMIFYEIALEIGLKDEIALNKFINRHTGKPPNAWKRGSKNG